MGAAAMKAMKPMKAAMKAMKVKKVMKKAMKKIHYCEGEARKGQRLPRLQGEDIGWPCKDRPHQEQARQDRLQESVGKREEKLCQGSRQMGEGSHAGKEGSWHHRLCGHWRQDPTGQGYLCQSQGHLQRDVRCCGFLSIDD